MESDEGSREFCCAGQNRLVGVEAGWGRGHGGEQGRD